MDREALEALILAIRSYTILMVFVMVVGYVLFHLVPFLFEVLLELIVIIYIFVNDLFLSLK